MITLIEEAEIEYDIKEKITTETYNIDSGNFIFNLNYNEYKFPQLKFKLIKDEEYKLQEILLIFEMIPSQDVLKISKVTGIETDIKLKIEKYIKSFLVIKKLHRVSLILRMKTDIIENYIIPAFESEEKPLSIFHINDENENSVVLNFSNYTIMEVIF